MHDKHNETRVFPVSARHLKQNIFSHNHSQSDRHQWKENPPKWNCGLFKFLHKGTNISFCSIRFTTIVNTLWLKCAAKRLRWYRCFRPCINHRWSCPGWWNNQQSTNNGLSNYTGVNSWHTLIKYLIKRHLKRKVLLNSNGTSSNLSRWPQDRKSFKTCRHKESLDLFKCLM